MRVRQLAQTCTAVGVAVKALATGFYTFELNTFSRFALHGKNARLYFNGGNGGDREPAIASHPHLSEATCP